MSLIVRSITTAAIIAVSVQIFSIGVLAPRLPREFCKPSLKESRVISFEAVPLLRLNHTDGAVDVSTHPGGKIEVEAEIRVYGKCQSEAETREFAESLVDASIVSVYNKAIYVVTEPEERPHNVGLRVDYHIRVPVNTNLALSVGNGNIHIGEGCGRITINAENTDVDIANPGSVLEVKSTNGRINVTGAPGRTRLETTNGSIRAAMLGGKLRAATTNGNIDAIFASSGVEVGDLTSLNGHITLSLCEESSVRVDATTGRGIIETDIPLAPGGAIEGRREMHGIIGSGATQLAMNSVNGNIRITRSGS
ncbi:MAG: DUF4097 family beta strand repeat protein [Candidatus Hydrogenedentes bacterium]|nr:DUF4097 family beta strand repeat protein [Candidatus Hydrogenedentota bacterium]